ncbi:RTA1 like protein-domain-containing protein [Gamsiella multidivaricata]|uniref:RTA1 like protein-domain-containing protein n=1 Tax=Gamsiella multidivaricata TaxID=101098 RepID=UPI00221EF964|nr:RTA1 like protein-domain-containing protein [Gamsiella multidivaricata]KAG0368707.1 hypothetical protein BGZ54_001349 [Gamsiella multidivaricata]KAI7830499.1 RTA1 like protein-domain-containing protein [Gamsiella multidivaricata]
MAERRSILAYEPSQVGNLVTGILYAIEGIVFLYYTIRHRNKWAICLPIGAICSSIGFFMRLTLDPDNFKLVPYIAQQAFVVISPCAFLAFNYMLYGRLIVAVDPQFGLDKSGSKMEKSRFSIIPPRIVGRTFVWSDAITFFIQLSAGGMQAAGGNSNPSLANMGNKLFLVAVSVQGASYCLFTVLLSVTLLRLIAYRRRTQSIQDRGGCMGIDRSTATIVAGLYFSSLFIIVRSIYRIVEFNEGYQGYLITHELYLFILDAIPLVIAIGIWAIVWPTVLLDRIASNVRLDSQGYAMGGSHNRVQSTESIDRSRLV